MTTQNYSFIPSALRDLTQTRGYKGDVAKYVSSHLNDDNDPVEALFEAFADSLENSNHFHPFSIVGFLQDIMNKSCWNARRLFNANTVADDPNGAPWGCDAAERAKEHVGMDINNEELLTTLDDDFDELYQLHVMFVQNLTADMDSTLCYFSRSQKSEIDDTWSVVAKCQSFNEAMDEMHSITDSLKVQQAENLRTTFNYIRQRRHQKVA
jgi:hypothetical protein